MPPRSPRLNFQLEASRALPHSTLRLHFLAPPAPVLSNIFRSLARSEGIWGDFPVRRKLEVRALKAAAFLGEAAGPCEVLAARIA